MTRRHPAGGTFEGAVQRRWTVLLAFAGVAVAAGIATGVAIATWPSTSHPWWYRSGTSACGYPAMYRVGQHSLQYLGDCAGNFFVPPISVSVQVGDQVDVHMVQEYSGPSGDVLVPTNPAPTSSNPNVLRQTSVTDRGSTVSFEAASAGTAELSTATPFCIHSTPPYASELGACPVLEVDVAPSPQQG